MDSSEGRFLDRALDLAERGRGAVEPNPVVGAVVARDGAAIAEAWHESFGGPHAEAAALDRAGPAARGADLHVTLEPCAHHGKTAPCVEAIRGAGIRRVVYALDDPDPRTRGRGAGALRAAGIEVSRAETHRAEAARQNAPFSKWTRTGLPVVTAKWAMTLDGRLATASGDSLYLTSEGGLSRAHLERARAGAICVGIGTALRDDPRLTVRPAHGDGGSAPPARPPLRVVLDSRARLPVTTRLVETAREAPVLVAATSAAPPERAEALRRAGVEVLTLPAGTDGRVDLGALVSALGARAIQSVLFEGGGEVLGALFSAGLMDRVVVLVAPRIAGGAGAPGAAGPPGPPMPVGGRGAARLADAPRIPGASFRVSRSGDDATLEAWIRDPAAEPA
ncbi:MAG: bifunctional diaminohydroxyphosphoribosylaminopyrimidine deaminase/5-amino-6-(5-phosphoribosylamino)uracil reductase RibD [Planctomycetales bacterium]|nr:bifunctional diaminohydroxyphosphoribosylaminopyrimidine deaminase/5-amino-6-(5-phosphoribosylamino)uracil reductase RibD [Planctomycetales bacterium]